MSLRIDHVDTEIEILRKADRSEQPASVVSGIEQAMGSRRGRAELTEKLRPIVLEILNDELNRIKRKVGAP